MDVEVKPGKYAVAVSGGVDSMALLHRLSRMRDLQLTVAHYDHGIRQDSSEDRRLVQQTAKAYGLPFVYDEGRLGAHASEQAARNARYKFLRTVATNTGAAAIITAHHQDDVLETAVHNLMRGTGRRGLTSLKSTDEIFRPLLSISKSAIIEYAQLHRLDWREDTSNNETRYARNHIRHNILTKADSELRTEMLSHIQKLEVLNEKIEAGLCDYLHLQPASDVLARYMFIMLPHIVAKEVLAAWLRKHGLRHYDRRSLERLTIAVKTAKPSTNINIFRNYGLHVGRKQVWLVKQPK